MHDTLIEYNKCFWENDGCGDVNNPEVFSYFEAGSRVCLSAPHATKTFANKKVKLGDLFTGCITRYVAEQTGTSYIVRNKFMPHKVLINDFIVEKNLLNHFFLDIHAMKDGNGFDLAVGTGYLPPEMYQKQLDFIKELCRQFDLKYVINHQHYTGCFGLTGRLQKITSEPQVLQLEWSRRYRDIFCCYNKVETVTVPFLQQLTIWLNNNG